MSNTEWRPISTAPDGDWAAEIDIWAQGQRYVNCVWTRPEYNKEKFYWCYSMYDHNYGEVFYEVIRPEFWMPIPSAPFCVEHPPKEK